MNAYDSIGINIHPARWPVEALQSRRDYFAQTLHAGLVTDPARTLAIVDALDTIIAKHRAEAAARKRREAYLAALKFIFHGFVIERSARACTRDATRALWEAAKYRAATYVFNQHTRSL